MVHDMVASNDASVHTFQEGKKKFDKKTAKFCQSQERTLSLSTKKPETVFQEVYD